MSAEAVRVRLRLNGREAEADVPATRTLRELLHVDLGAIDVRYGCGEGACGACAVLLDGRAVASCLLLAAQADGREVVTAAGLDAPALRAHLHGAGAFQCGYCASGMQVSAAHHLQSGGGGDPAAVRRALSGNLCRCTGYEAIVQAVRAAAAGEEPPPPRPARLDLGAKLEGSARYPTDALPAGALHGRVVWAAHASAHVRSVDVAEARAVPGVVAVLTAADIPGRNLAPGSIFAHDQPLLASDRVRSFADAVALVAAETLEAAREAAARVKVDYELLPAVHDMRAALAPGAPHLHAGGNVVTHLVEERGDVEGGFARAARVIEATYGCGSSDHATIELEGGTGWMEEGVLVLRVPAQTPFVARRGVAKALGLPQAQVRMVTERMGGAFGKYLVPSVEGWLALLVHATRRPVRLVMERAEMLQRRVKRHAFEGRYRLALDAEGRFLAMEAELLADAGPYVILTPPVASIFAAEAAGAYEVPALRVSVRGVATHNLPAAPMRGFGSQQVNFGMECLVERAGRETGLGPVEIRRRNFREHLRHGDAEDLGIALDRITEALGPRPEPPPGWKVGRGYAAVHVKYGYPYGITDRAVARVSVDAEGRFLVESDLADAGTGAPFGIVQLVAEKLGLEAVPRYEQSRDALDDPTGYLLTTGRPAGRWRRTLYDLLDSGPAQLTGLLLRRIAPMRPGRLRLLMRVLAPGIALGGFTAAGVKQLFFPFGIDAVNPRTSGSRGVFMTGRAALDAAASLSRMAIDAAALLLRAKADALETFAGGVRVRAEPGRAVAWGELAAAAGGRLSACGQASLPFGWAVDPRTGNQTGPVDSTSGVHACDLAVEPETGAVRILRWAASHDFGHVIDPVAVRGQVVGGLGMGVGQALLERLEVVDGRVRNGGLREYLIPTALDLPDDLRLLTEESGAGAGPGGSRGVGEAGAVAPPIAICAALWDALGTQPTHVPLSPEQISAMAQAAPAEVAPTV
ncbi:MAG: molybdopterin-dependent oxidoreductase [Longimicrobiaceae bacterium]